MRHIVMLLAAIVVSQRLAAQDQQGKEKKHKKDSITVQADLVPHDAARIFTNDQPIAFTLTANFNQLHRDKSPNPPWRAATLTIADSTGANVDIPLKVRTRGIWRLRECDFPPLRLDFAKHTVKHSLFAKLDKPKLVTHCRDRDNYEQYILQEFELYRVYNLLTPYSHRVRLARVTYVDSGTNKPVTTRYAFLSEEPEAVAYRVGGLQMKAKGAVPNDLDPERANIFFLFQYLIGNTDFSVAGLHNVEIISRDTTNVPVAYDFDFSGAVNAHYATVDPSLSIKRVRDRIYRGYCYPPETFLPVFDLFHAKKDSIYALYKDSIGKLLQGDRAKETLEYFDEFYEQIGNPKEVRRVILERCLGRR